MEAVNTRLNVYSNTGGKPGIIQQILIAVAVVVILYIVLSGIESIYRYINRLSMNRVELLPNTYSTEGKSITIYQNPADPNAMPITPSNNERSGPEFTYSFFIYVNPNSFRAEKGLLHVFHKGNPGQYPLMAPGVYMRSDTNCMRVYMNTFETWNKYVEIDNIPISKWVYVTVICRGMHLEVYINGNLSKKLSFEGYQGYQNYGNLYCFSQRRITVPKRVPSVGDEGFDVFGAMKGMMSRLIYFNYALSYTEINALMNEGPSTKMDSAAMDKPPYLGDDWWTTNY
jgi:hypothetical protein